MLQMEDQRQPEPLLYIFIDVYAPKTRISRFRIPKIKQENTVDQTVDELFNKLFENSQAFINEQPKKPEEYKPETKTKGDAPEYKALRVGPKPLTIAEYRKRQEERKLAAKEAYKTATEKKKKTRAGKRVQRKKEINDLYRILPIATGNTKRQLINKLRELKALQYGRPSNEANRFNGNKTRSQPPQQ